MTKTRYVKHAHKLSLVIDINNFIKSGADDPIRYAELLAQEAFQC